MKAAQINKFGEVTEILVKDAVQPKPNKDQVLVRVDAASLNPFDISVLNGKVASNNPIKFPLTLGQDFAGTVVEVGQNVKHLSIGMKVYGTANALFGGSGAFAEYVVANASNVAKAPENIDILNIASLPTAGSTALQAIKNLSIKHGDKLFIHGGAGGVGSFAIQIAKHHGAYVATTASTVNCDYVRLLGADEVIDYTRQNYNEIVQDFDALLNAVRTNSNALLDTIKKGGKAVSLNEAFDINYSKNREISTLLQSTKISSELLSELAHYVNQGIIKSTVDHIFSLDQIREAYSALINQSIRGKIVISISE